MSIKPYLTHLVDIVTVTISKGERTETTATDVPCFITSRREVIRDVSGDRLASKTIVYFNLDQAITESDELIIDGEQRAIELINRPRNAVGIHHKTVTLQ